MDKYNKPYYVGRTNNFNRRRKEHLREIEKGNKAPKYNKARKTKFKMRTIATTGTIKNSKDLEKFFISKYRSIGYKLYNLTAGGE